MLWSSAKYQHHPSIFFLCSSHIRVDLLSYQSKPTDKREQYNFMAVLCCLSRQELISHHPILLNCWLWIDTELAIVQCRLLGPSKKIRHSVVIFSFISRFALVRRQIDSNTTGWQKKSGQESNPWHRTCERCRLVIPMDLSCRYAVF